MYHRWQNETGPPLDFAKGEGYQYARPGSARQFEKTSLFPTILAGAPLPGFMCGDPLRNDPQGSGLPCSPFDGHDELVGFRAMRSSAATFLNFSLAVDLRVPLGVRAGGGWPSRSELASGIGRYNKFMDMTSPDPDDNWAHRPAAPQLCLVCDDLVALTRSLYQERNPVVPVTDITAPSTSANADPAPNPEGWNAGDVVIDLAATDGGSGVKEIEHSVAGAEAGAAIVTAGAAATRTLVAEGTTTLSFQARDVAGNEETVRSLEVHIDRTPPSISAEATTMPNASGWYRGAVDVLFTASDALSGLLSSPEDVTISTEGAEQEVVGSAEDKAGNVAPAAVLLNIDLTPPDITFASRTPANAAGWNKSDVTVSWNCADALSGAASASVSESLGSEGLALTLAGTCLDVAGNAATDTQSQINIDTTAPQVALASRTPANAAGWNNSDVSVVWNCTDGLSGPGSPSVSASRSSEGAAQAATGTCVDLANNSANVTESGIHIDKTAPSVTINAPANGAVLLLNAPAASSYVCGDSLSGVQSCNGPVASGSPAGTSSVGSKQFTVNASDAAGNTASATHSYSVQYAFSGFSNPIAALPTINSANAGRTVPVNTRFATRTES